MEKKNDIKNPTIKEFIWQIGFTQILRGQFAKTKMTLIPSLPFTTFTISLAHIFLSGALIYAKTRDISKFIGNSNRFNHKFRL